MTAYLANRQEERVPSTTHDRENDGSHDSDGEDDSHEEDDSDGDFEKVEVPVDHRSQLETGYPNQVLSEVSVVKRSETKYTLELSMSIGSIAKSYIYNCFSFDFEPSKCQLYVRPALKKSYLPAQLKLLNIDRTEGLYISSGGLQLINNNGRSFISIATYLLQETLVWTIVKKLERVEKLFDTIDLNIDITKFKEIEI